MMGKRQGWNEARGLLTRLARDTRGNTLAIMAIALFPLAGMIGGGLDIGRLYIVKTRLQHACDAGALAGRKAMGGGVWAQKVNGTDNYPNTTAERFFSANYNSQAYGVNSTTVTKSFTENAGKVSGAASVEVPMTLMRIFGRTKETLSVTCDAEMRLPNTDVMFVLDVTGSMNDKVVSTDSQTKIEALRSSVKCFYEIVARLDTDENCTGSPPSGGVGDDVQVRFGFVPYDMNVNVGKLLPADYFVNDWKYQSRENVEVSGTPTTYSDGSYGSWSGWSNKTATTANAQTCSTTYGVDFTESRGVAGGGKNETNDGVEGGGNWQADTPWREVDRTYTSWSSGANNCKYQERTRNLTRTFTYREVPAGTANATVFNIWRYKQLDKDVSVLKNGNVWTDTTQYTAPARSGNAVTTQSYTWAGCIEERKTVRASSYTPVPDDAHDLQIDEVPGWSDDTRWAPALDGYAFPRRENYSNSSAYSLDPIRTFTSYSKSWDCPTQAKKLQEWKDASAFDSYVDSIWGGGNTYHDIGLVWGARLLSPTGMFRSENEFTPKGGEIQRHMIFMTDGEACTSEVNYQAYGLGWWDRRQTDPTVGPTSGCQTTGTLTQQVNARTAGLCKAIQNKNITLWVIWFGATNTLIENQLKACANPSGKYYTARNPAELQDRFREIATEISQLRLTK
jgi:Flp pilus assembly protein TadG